MLKLLYKYRNVTQLAYRVTGVYIGIAAGCVAVVGAVVVAGIVVFRR